MDNSVKIILSGYSGKMGQAIRGLCETREGFEVVAGLAVHNGNVIFPAHVSQHSPGELEFKGDVVVDFSHADAVSGVVSFARKNGMPLVVCTTGISPQASGEIVEASQDIAVFRSANMSLGLNLMSVLLKKAASVLQPAGFDIEIVEMHHNLKVDAPSGTALLLADAINTELGNTLRISTDRSSRRQRRSAEEIGIHAVRGGSVAGEHSVIFAGEDELLEFRHSAQSKQIFAAGALRAAKFISGKPPGMYSMDDILSFDL